MGNKVGELSDGAEFGELALLTLKPRAASIFTETDTYLATLDREAFNSVIYVISKCNNRFSKSPRLRGLTKI